jgi:hypothetical protein
VSERPPTPKVSIRARILDGVDELLFYGSRLDRALEVQAQKLREAIEAEPEESLKQTDPGEWAAALAHHFAVGCPKLKADERWMEPPEDVKLDVSGDPGRYFSYHDSTLARNYPGERIVVHIPFEGDAGVFKLQPDHWSTTFPRGRLGSDELLLTIDYTRGQAPNVDGPTEGFINKVSQYLEWARQQIDAFNQTLESEARNMIDARRQRVEQRDAQLAKSSIPMRRPGEKAKTYIPDVLLRRPAPSLPATRADDKPPKLEPTLPERVFEHILGVVRMQARQMEQSPGTYAGMGEEDRRQTLVATLNTHYEGRAAAEAFNVAGKTDILIRHDGRSLFICECKFWTGPDGFSKTIDQLFSYTGWRDTKLAIVMFVREKGLTAIIKKAKQTLAEHSQFVAWKEAAEETELRAEMSWPGDPERRADLNVFFVHTPEARK